MKKNYLLNLAIATIVASLSACSNDSEEILSQGNEIKLTSEIMPSRVPSLDYQSIEIVEGQKVGVTITGASSVHNNVQWTAGVDGTLTNGGAPIYYKGNEEATIAAYHPFNNSWAGINQTFSVNTDQSTNEGYLGSDLLWATETATHDETVVALTFSHKLAKINVTLTSTDITDLSGAVISICGTNTDTNINLSTGELSEATTANVQEIKAGVTTQTAFTASAIVVPQTVASGTKFIKVSHGGHTFYYTLSAAKDLKSGYSHNYTLTIKNVSEMELKSNKISEWKEDNNVGDAEQYIPSYYEDGVAFIANAGDLSAVIPEDKKYTITTLKVVGDLNGSDFRFLREMAGVGDIVEDIMQTTAGKLVNLDLSQANIVEGGDIYFRYNEYSYNTVNNTITEALLGFWPMQTIVLPNSATIIGTNAFWASIALTSINIPNSVTSIGNSAFANCRMLTTVTIPNSVTSIGDNAFYGCQELSTLNIPNSVKSIGNDAFRDCSSLTSVTIANSVTSIGNQAFRNCSLTSITIPSSVTSIGYSAFYNCPLTAVHIEDLEAWCKIEFENGGNPVYQAKSLYINGEPLVNLTIPNTITTIGVDAFTGCESLETVVIPNTVTAIGEDAFAGCSKLSSVSIPNSVKSIEAGAFTNCKLLETVTIPNTVTSIGSHAFSFCDKLTSMVIPNSVTSLGSHMFSNCRALREITIGSSVESIGEQAFVFCTSLNTVTCLAETPPTLGEMVFYGSGGFYLYVPKNSISAYENSIWSYSEIIGLD